MERERERSVADDAMLIERVIAGELRSGIPEKSVEDFNFKGSQIWDLDGWFQDKDAEGEYIYLNRGDGVHVTCQKCRLYHGEDILTYWNVYMEKEDTDKGITLNNQATEHKFRWVRSLKHAMKLGEFAGDLMLKVAYPEDYFLTKKEYDDFIYYGYNKDEKLQNG